MATYKVIQDIEAEDHILGPLSLRQFIYGLIAALCFYLCYFSISKHVPFLIAIFLPPAAFATFFAFPFGKDQPTEVWALAKIRFLFKPRKRVWDQDGMKELVTITVPKHIEEHRTNGLSEVEVRSRLSALANTIDSRGWAIKNVNVNMYSQPSLPVAPTNTDRLVEASSLPQAVPENDITASDDIMDAQNNPIAQQFEQMINNSEQSHRQKLQTMMSSPTPPPQPDPSTANGGSAGATTAAQPNYWFLNEPAAPPKLEKDQAMFAPQIVMPGNDDADVTSSIPIATPAAPAQTDDEAELSARLKQSHADRIPAAFGRMKTILPLDQQKPAAPPPPPTPPQPNPAVQQLATNDDLNIATVAREAERINHPNAKNGDDEVVVSLH